jgi:hypothetical protein
VCDRGSADRSGLKMFLHGRVQNNYAKEITQ